MFWKGFAIFFLGLFGHTQWGVIERIIYAIIELRREGLTSVNAIVSVYMPAWVRGRETEANVFWMCLTELVSHSSRERSR